MSNEALPSLDQIEATTRKVLNEILPLLVKKVMVELKKNTPNSVPRPKKQRTADIESLTVLIDAARKDGKGAVVASLDRPLPALRAIALALDRTMAARFRKSENVERMRDEIADEIMRRAFRNDVFLEAARRDDKSS